MYRGRVTSWWCASKRDNAFVVYSVRKGDASATYANFVKLCDGCPEPNAIALRVDGFTLHVHLEGESEGRTFNLKELGIL